METKQKKKEKIEVKETVRLLRSYETTQKMNLVGRTMLVPYGGT